MLLKTVTPAQRRGANAAGSTSEGILTVASVSRMQYSATFLWSASSLSLKVWNDRRTSPVTGEAVDLLFCAGLIETTFALLAVALKEWCQYGDILIL
jgi:hypothetical protein